MSHSKIASRREEALRAKKKKQWMIIGVLVIGLVIAFATQPKNDESGDTTGVVVASTSIAKVSNSSSAVAKASQNRVFEDSIWKTAHKFSRRDFETITNHSVFADQPRPISLPQPASPVPSRIEVRAVYGTAKQQSALVQFNQANVDIVRSGDRIHDGRQAIVNDHVGVKLVPVSN